MIGRKPKLQGPPPPRKSRVVIGNGGVIPRKLPTVVSAQPRAIPMKPVGPRIPQKARDQIRNDILVPHRHVEAPAIRNLDLRDYWDTGRVVGDMLVTIEHMCEIGRSPNEIEPKHPYLQGDPYQSGGNYAGLRTTAQPVTAGTYGIYAGTVRTLERGRSGNIAVLRHTAIFPSGRYILTDLNLVHPVETD